MKKIFLKRWIVSLVVCLCVISAQADELEMDGSRLEHFEQQMEMKRHEGFIIVKNDSSRKIEAFSTDGCSGGLSIGWSYLAGQIKQFQDIHGEKPPWESCCVAHDRVYHTGGSATMTALASFNARKEADLNLKQCVRDTGVNRAPELSAAYRVSEKEVAVLYSAISELMYVAVRVGGVPCSDLPWRWGYGWPMCE